MRRVVALVALLAAGAFACSASDDVPDDHAVNGADQEIQEAPCGPIKTLKCAAGYHSISTARCDADGEGRCVADSCELASTLACVKGWAPTTSGCKQVNGKYARCAALDAGAHDAGHD